MTADDQAHRATIASVADVEAVEQAGWPTDAPTNTYDMITRSAALSPEAPALTFFLSAADHRRSHTWTYSELLGEINRTANAFHELDARDDTVIAYLLPNLPETHFTIWGGQAAGVVFAVNPLLEPATIADLLNAAGATILVTLAPFPGTDLWTRVYEVLPLLDSVRHVVLVDMAHHVGGARGTAASAVRKGEMSRLRGGPGARGALPAGIEVHDFADLVKRQPSDRLVSGRVIDPDDLSSYFCTGGTTGLPKIAMRRHRNEVANVISALYVLSDAMGPGRTVFCGLPLFHVNAVLVTGLAPFSRGAHVVLGTPQGYRGEGVLDKFWEIVEHYRIHFFSGVPTVYSALLERSTADHDLSSLQYGLCGAAPLPVQLMRRFEATTGITILEGYGLTEGTCVSAANPAHGERRAGSIGLRIPFQDMRTVVLDDNGEYRRECDSDEVGALVISGPNVFAGYRNAEHDHKLWIDLGDGQRWLNTGDLGRQDSDGYFWLTGRRKELIIRGGHNIDPAQIEEPLYAHSAVRHAAAVGRPDPHAGELPVAYVELEPGARASEQELLAFARQRIGERAAHPKAVRILDEMPLTAVGKIHKPTLAHREVTSALRAALAGAGVTVEDVTIDTAAVPPRVVVTVHGDAERKTADATLGMYAIPFTVQTAASTT